MLAAPKMLQHSCFNCSHGCSQVHLMSSTPERTNTPRAKRFVRTLGTSLQKECYGRLGKERSPCLQVMFHAAILGRSSRLRLEDAQRTPPDARLHRLEAWSAFPKQVLACRGNVSEAVAVLERALKLEPESKVGLFPSEPRGRQDVSGRSLAGRCLLGSFAHKPAGRTATSC